MDKANDVLARAVAAEPSAALDMLDTTAQGLSSAEAARRLATYGPNEVQTEQRSLAGIIREQAQSGINVLLALAGVLTFVVGDIPDGSIILVLVVVNVGLSIIQEYRAERALAALRELLPLQAHVLRDGAVVERPASQVVPGDVVTVRSGALVPADMRLLEVSQLEVDQATLTGESVPQTKMIDAVADGPVSGWTDALFAGTTVVSGQGRGV